MVYVYRCQCCGASFDYPGREELVVMGDCPKGNGRLVPYLRVGEYTGTYKPDSEFPNPFKETQSADWMN